MTDNLFHWDTLHKQLQDIMKEELNMLREVLSMMRQEEEALIQRNILSKKSFGSKRSSLNKQLKILQKERSCLTKALTQAANKDFYIHHFNSKNFNILISQDEDNSVETFHLRDQILHLMKNIKRQKDRIATLVKAGDTTAYLEMSIIPIAKQEDSTKKIQTINNEEAVNE
jgi:flagellar biosynthesis/type III secretory pathway chaperone